MIILGVSLNQVGIVIYFPQDSPIRGRRGHYYAIKKIIPNQTTKPKYELIRVEKKDHYWLYIRHGFSYKKYTMSEKRLFKLYNKDRAFKIVELLEQKNRVFKMKNEYNQITIIYTGFKK